MRIVLCKGQFMGPISGADETIVTYATQLRIADHDPTVLIMYPYAADDQYYMRLKSSGVPVHTIATPGRHTSLRIGRKLAAGVIRAFPLSHRLIRGKAQKISTRMASRYSRECRDYFLRCKADVIHVMTPDPSAMVMIKAAYDAGIPVLYQELGTPYQPPAFAAYYEQFVSVLPLCTELAALSPSLIRECREQLPYMLPLSVLPIIAEDLLDVCESYPKSPDVVTFGFAARVERLKGPLVLIEAFASVCRMFVNSLLKIAGVGAQRQQAIAQSVAAGVGHCCDFPGAYTSPEGKRAFMRSLDVFILPSLTEGTPNGIVEAMACGLPVIASAIGGVPDMITPETGLLVPPGQPLMLAQAMGRLAADRHLRERMGRAARRRYEDCFSPRSVLPLMLKTYRRVAAGRPAKDVEVVRNFKADVHPWGPTPYRPVESGAGRAGGGKSQADDRAVQRSA